MMDNFDVAVVGGGIVGLAHAWSAAKRGLSVLLLDRDPQACGASVRNFGMVWPIGQPSGDLYTTAMQSRSLWLELSEAGAVEAESCGSLHLAYRDDELAVLREFCAGGTHACELIDSQSVLAKAPFVQCESLLGGLWSSTEIRVNPRQAIPSLLDWLRNNFRVIPMMGRTVVDVSDHFIESSDGSRWRADKIIICSGSDLRTLYPEVLQNAGLRLCKLQMLEATTNTSLPPAAPHIAGGLTLRHYKSFESCRSLDALKQRIERETPELNAYGIHVMASMLPNGRVILGDSHEYNEAISPFDKSVIDDLILRELQLLLDMRMWSITQRWHGIYAKHEALPVFHVSLDDGIEVFTGTGGAGMTMAFGLAEQAWKKWESA